MALTIDPATKVISIPQADLTLDSGTLYVLDSNQFRKDVFDLLASENYIWMQDAYAHNGEITVAGTTYARTLEFINGYSIQLEDTGSAYSVRIEGSNNNLFDLDAGVLNPTDKVTVVPTNSSGLQVVPGVVTQQDKNDIVTQIFANVVDAGFTFNQIMVLLSAIAGGDIIQQPNGSYVIKGLDDVTNRVEGNLGPNNGRDVTNLDLT